MIKPITDYEKTLFAIITTAKVVELLKIARAQMGALQLCDIDLDNLPMPEDIEIAKDLETVNFLRRNAEARLERLKIKASLLSPSASEEEASKRERASKDAVALAHRAIRELLSARGTNPKSISSTVLADDVGPFIVRCARGEVSIEPQEWKRKVEE